MNTQHSSITLPLFPLPIVAFPGAYLPLHIFEDRYKRMTEDVMRVDGRFCITRTDGHNLARVGCVVEIVTVQPLGDGCMNIAAKGLNRFAIESLCEKRAYKQAIVTPIEESEPNGECLRLAKKVSKALGDVCLLSSKVFGTNLDLEQMAPKDPVALSFWIPSRIYDSPVEQQKILETDCLEERLESELALLAATRNHLAAQAAVKDVFG